VHPLVERREEEKITGFEEKKEMLLKCFF